MKTLNYIETRDKMATESISKSLKNLPEFAFDFFIGIENNTSALTRKNYAQDLEIFFDYLKNFVIKKEIYVIELNDLNKIRASHIEAFLSYLTFYDYKGKTHKNNEKAKARKLASIRSFFKFYYNKDKLDSNVASKVETPKLHDKEIVRLEADEVAALLNLAESANNLTNMQQKYHSHTKERDVAILTLFLGTGIRISELVGINIEDIDFKQNAFVITRKGGNKTVLYFSEEVKKALLQYTEKRNQFEISLNEKALFLSLQMKRISVRAVENLVGKYAFVVSPLKKISPHKLRSTYGTNLYRETGDIYIVADVLGHKDVNTTKKHYAAISEDLRRSVAEKVKLK